MVSYSLYSYLAAAFAYSVLFLLLILNKKNNTVFYPFLTAVLFSFIWSAYSAHVLQDDNLYIFETLALESLRNGAWYFFLSVLFSKQQFCNQYGFIKHYWQPKAMLAFIIVISFLEFYSPLRYWVQSELGFDFRLFAHIAFAIIGLLLIEQLYRNSLPEQRWNIKYVCIGAAGLFIFDFIVYSKSLLFSSLDSDLWKARGVINALLVPLFILSINRLNISPGTFSVSKKIIFHSTVLVGAGIYLLIMSLMGFYIRDYGGSWGGIAQIGFIFLAVLLLLVFFVSGRVRALAKVYFSKHFFQHRYDYREEWIKLSRTLAQLNSIDAVSGFIVKTLADLVDSIGGGLWLKNDQGDFYLAEDINLGFQPLQLISRNDPVLTFFNKTNWVIDFVEYFNDPEIYAGAELEKWYRHDNNIWLMIPLCLQNELEAFVVLSKPRVARQIDWQDHDLLKTVGMQLANALALTRASDDLSRSRQFEAYNRLSAFLVHDLKNLVAQISLIVKNSERHKNNPEFIDDSIETLENVVVKMEKILSQLKKGGAKKENGFQEVDLADVLKDVAIQQSINKPRLQLILNSPKSIIRGDKEKLTSIISHLAQNAQDATADAGWVRLELYNADTQAIVKIIDNGCGMDKQFIQQRLFKPFDTTKGNAGMGIGVYEAREYILQHSGQILVDSEPGRGTTFTLKFPLI
ncbi:XrtA/PEP-CTERM system histidine kinase PrsK [Methylomarinum vadi]|uniref:XrtA/PEP-CTERM system histidine kinase PrsK n=1 Tax=Methylomarinum vadi TaxID=438855 RepID=UPI0004DF26AA|nr:XrtA/PEP-CTERM system histidine kinase PrsK [Methylomarinum vadi]